ncbi:MAG: glycosyltransferase [Treponema sp.]|nr:glycosyltransferase [Treponema sp.]
MNTGLLVSVIIPAYNAERYVESALRSVMAQSYTNLEILVADDCSSDGTLSVIERLAAEDARITVFRNAENRGIVSTLNALVDAARGTYIARMDADDICMPRRIERQVAFLESHPDYALCGTNAWHIDEDGRRIGKTRLPTSCDDNRFFLRFYSTLYHPTVMARSEVLRQNSYSADFPYAEDYELWCRLVFARGMNAANLAERLLLYRVSSSQSSATHCAEQTRSSARIFDAHDIINKEHVPFHQNIFFAHERSLSNADELMYAKTAGRSLRHRRMRFSCLAYQKLLFHASKCFGMGTLTFFAMNPLGICALAGLAAKRMGKRLRMVFQYAVRFDAKLVADGDVQTANSSGGVE